MASSTHCRVLQRDRLRIFRFENSSGKTEWLSSLETLVTSTAQSRQTREYTRRSYGAIADFAEARKLRVWFHCF